jgi:hypothetical protein
MTDENDRSTKDKVENTINGTEKNIYRCYRRKLS